MNSLSDDSRMLDASVVRIADFLSSLGLRNGCIFQANFIPSKSLRNCAVRFERVYAATQGRRLVYMRSHLSFGLGSKSLIQREKGLNELWQGNCHA
jgi:hypothetical protein